MIHGPGRAFYASAGKPRPCWIDLGSNVKALADLGNWPVDIGMAFMRIDKTNSGRDDFESMVQKCMIVWADPDMWLSDPEAEKNAPPGMIVRRIRLDSLPESTRTRLLEGHWYKTNKWISDSLSMY